MKNIKSFSSLGFIISMMVLSIILVILSGSFSAHASSPSGLPAVMATSSTVIVGPGNSMTAFATSTCASRVISTVAQPVMITFTDNAGQSPTGTYGHLQAASTSMAYDSGLYGCGALKVYGFVASTTITVSEAR